MAQYILSVQSKSQNDLYDEIEGATVVPLSASVGEPAWFAVLQDGFFSKHQWMCFHTSRVREIVVDPDGVATLLTLNSVYTLRKIDDREVFQ